MQKMLIKHGNSLALVIDKPILEMLQIDATTPLQLTTNGDQILVTPCRDKARQKKLAATGSNRPLVIPPSHLSRR